MKKLRIFFLICLILFNGSITDSQSKIQCDSNCLDSVRNFISEKESGFSTGFAEKQINRLGDKVSVALKKLYSRNDIKATNNVKSFLSVIEEAFRYPELIVETEDRKSNNTIKLLRKLLNQVNDTETKNAINRTINFVLEKTKDGA